MTASPKVLFAMMSVALAASTSVWASPDLGSCQSWNPAASCNYTASSRPGAYPILYVIIHKAEGSAASAASWFQNCSAGASAHYSFDNTNGYCYQMVYEKDIAWHAANWSTNCRSVGIEHGGYTANNDTAAACYNHSAEETRSCMYYYGTPGDRAHILGHSEVPGATHTDPGPYWNWSYYMSQCNPAPVASDVGVVGDWNGDGVSTPGILRGFTWYLKNSNSSGVHDITFTYGESGDVPLAGDWNGDGIETIGVYRPSNATFYLRNSNSSGAADIIIPYGNGGDLPVVGDWNGDGIDTIGVYRPSTGYWYLKNGNDGGPTSITFSYGGVSGDQPVVGDWDHNGTVTPGIHRADMWYLRNSNSSGVADFSFQYGNVGDVPLTGDWNGDGTDTIGVKRGSWWYLRNSNNAGGANIEFSYGN